jgi:hypothetical protein
MSVDIYTEGENQFLSDMEGPEHLIMSFPVSGT